MSDTTHADLQAALDAEHAQRIALQHHAADQAQRVADLEAEIERITEAGRVHIRRAAAFEAQRDGLLAALKSAQFVPDDFWGNPDPSTDICPECWRTRSEGHAPDCALSAAIARAEGGAA